MVNVLNDLEEVYSLDGRENQALQSLVDEVGETAVIGTEPKALVELELKKKRILEAESKRVNSRVLFVTSDETLLEAEKLDEQFGSLYEVFDEVHILLLTDYQKKQETRRVNKVTWVYYASSKTLLLRVKAGLKMIKRELTFTDGFRPDLIVALDPYESSQVALEAADTYERPWQMHVMEAGLLLKQSGTKRTKKQRWQEKIALYTIPEAESIRCATEQIKTIIQSKYKKATDDIEVLPRFYDVSKLLATPANHRQEHDLFSQFAFTILYIGKLDADSQFHMALDAARHLLRTPTVGLVVIGIGPMKDHFAERARLLGVDKQVVFLGERTDYKDELMSAHLLLLPEASADQDRLMITAAAVGTPVIAATNELRASLFEDKVSSLLVEPNDLLGMSKALKSFMNTNALRTQLALNARQAVEERIVEDPHMYRIAYRNSIETVLLRESDELQRETVSKQITAAHQEAARRQDRFREIDGKSYKLPKQLEE